MLKDFSALPATTKLASLLEDADPSLPESFGPASLFIDSCSDTAVVCASGGKCLCEDGIGRDGQCDRPVKAECCRCYSVSKARCEFKPDWCR